MTVTQATIRSHGSNRDLVIAIMMTQNGRPRGGTTHLQDPPQAPLYRLQGRLRVASREHIPHTGYAQEQGGDYPRQQATTYHTSSGVPGKKLR